LGKLHKEFGMRRTLFALMPLSVLFFSPASMLSDSPQEATQQQNERVGKVNFPTLCSDSVQSTMERGLALLHSFQYQEAGQAFSDASRHDPRCALAYWGEGMALYEQLWDSPTKQTLAKGRQDIAQAQMLAVEDPRIREYIEAAAAFYQDADLKPVARVQAYSSAMEKLHRDQPEDNEAGELYALSLISLAQMGVDDLPNRKKAIAVLTPIFSKYPDNPGAAHYLIHASDVRELAPEGLAAARVYAKIAPHSAHALHMPSHIFRRLGMWQEVINSNIASAAAAAEATEEHRSDASYQFHAMEFLDYAYLQRGEGAKARGLVAELQSVPQGGESNIINEQNQFAARNALELHLWKEAAALEIPKERLVWQDYTYWTRAIGAGRSGDVQGARDDVQKLAEIAQLVKLTQVRQMQMSGMAGPGLEIDPTEAGGWLAYAEGKPDEAVAMLSSAAKREDARDAEPFAMPAREMLADLLLSLRRPAEALAAYKTVLADFPNRFDALYGAAQAADSLGDRRTAADFYSKVISNCPPNADRPELLTARKYLAAHPN
jgi:tetratricopeptide (TPR) repeat protein